MSQIVAQQRCFHHSLREAVARCPECGRFFCRECVTEHEGRVLCASCILRLVQPEIKHRGWTRRALRVIACVASIVFLWLFFYSLGKGLSELPSTFHEQTLWQQDEKDS